MWQSAAEKAAAGPEKSTSPTTTKMTAKQGLGWLLGLLALIVIAGALFHQGLFADHSSINAQISKAAGVKETGCSENSNLESLEAGKPDKIYICNSGDTAVKHNREFQVTPISGTAGASGGTPTDNGSECVVNGIGNELCGDAAVAYCGILMSPSPGSAVPDPNTQNICEQLGVQFTPAGGG